jgi:hypothetical protein
MVYFECISLVLFRRNVDFSVQATQDSIRLYPNRVFSALTNSRGKRLLRSSCLPVRPTACIDSAPNGRISIKFDIAAFHKNLSAKSKSLYIGAKILGTLPKEPSKFNY